MSEGQNVNRSILGSGITATGPGQWVPVLPGAKTFQAHMTVTSGAGTATVLIEACVDQSFLPQQITSLSVTDTTDGAQTTNYDAYAFHRMNVTVLTGAGASISTEAGC